MDTHVAFVTGVEHGVERWSPGPDAQAHPCAACTACTPESFAAERVAVRAPRQSSLRTARRPCALPQQAGWLMPLIDGVPTEFKFTLFYNRSMRTQLYKAAAPPRSEPELSIIVSIKILYQRQFFFIFFYVTLCPIY